MEISDFLLKSSIVLLVFYAAYWFLLRKTTHFKLNRYFLLTGLLFSLTIPFMHFSLPQDYPQEIFITLDSIDVQAVYVAPVDKSFDFIQVLLWIYYAGVLLLSFRLMVQLVLIFKLYFQSKKEQIDGKTVVLTNKNNASFSFFSLIFINQSDRNSDEFKAILRHEYVHISQMHSVDIMFAELLSIVLWFNPFAWLYLKSIKANHEFLADEGVVKAGFSTNRYVEILFEQSSGLRLSLANNFNKSLTFKRLNMMKKIRSHKITQLKILIALPVIIAMIVFVSCSKELLDVQTQKTEEVKDFDPKIADAKNSGVEGEVFFITEEMPQFPGGELGLRKFIAMNVKYPQEARENNVQGKVYVRFIVTKTGDVDSVTVQRGVDPSLDAEAVRVVKALPKWKPGMQRGVPVNVYYTVPINFSLKSEENNHAVTAINAPNPDTNSEIEDKTINVITFENARNNKLKQEKLLKEKKKIKSQRELLEAELETTKKQLNNAKSEKEAEILIRKMAELKKQIKHFEK
jgi:TonB family protein